jgi:SAM-dependent methyltransferase
VRWWMKAAAQAGISLLPAGEAINYRLQLLNGFETNIATEVTHGVGHLRAMVNDLSRCGGDMRGRVLLEVGTGWLPTMSVGAALLGASVHTYDHVVHLREANVRRVLDLLEPQLEEIANRGSDRGTLARSLEAFRAAAGSDVRHWLASCGVFYHAPGDAAATQLAAGSVDVHFSLNVLEHVPRATVSALLREAYRILKPGGLLRHRIDTGDHYAHSDRRITAINFLKYSDLTWRIIGQNRIHFTNRLRKSEYLAAFEAAGLEILDCQAFVDDKSISALNRLPLNRRYRHMDMTDLATINCTVIARKPVGSR